MTNVMFNRERIEAEIVNLQALVDAIKANRGTASARTRKATDQALTESVTFSADDVPEFFSVDNVSDGVTSAQLVDVAQYVVDVTTWAEQLRDERVAAILKNEKTSDNTAALKEQYTSKRNLVEAMMTLCAADGIDVSDIKVPHVGGGRPKGSQNTATTRTPGSKWAHFYRVINGQRRDQSGGQNTFSSFAFYHSEKMTGEKMGVADFAKWLNTNHGVDSPIGKSWSITVDDVTYGNDVSDDSEDVSNEGSEEE